LRKISAIIADDEPLARERVRSVLKDEPDVEIVVKCADGAQALKALKETQNASRTCSLCRCRGSRASRCSKPLSQGEEVGAVVNQRCAG
jgi:CheY-like chemotaxis protein